MDDGEPTSSGTTPGVVVRDYASADHAACRMLWVQLTEHHRRIYDDPSIGGDDPGSGFDDYLALPERLASWVADLDGRVVGLTRLLDRGTSGEVEPVVVSDRQRDRGVGRLLIERVVTEAVDRGYGYLAIRPVARNVSAIQRFYRAGFQTLGGHVDLTMDLADRRHRWLDGARLHGLDLRYRSRDRGAPAEGSCATRTAGRPVGGAAAATGARWDLPRPPRTRPGPRAGGG